MRRTKSGKAAKSWRVVVVLASGEESNNAIRFETQGDANVYGTDLLSRWTLPVSYHVEECIEKPTHRITLYPLKLDTIWDQRT